MPVTPTYSATKAAIHSYTESLREQLRDTSVQVIEVAPPHTRTALMGSEHVDSAMPLDEFLSETMNLLESQPDAQQILVERVKRQRFAEASGTYDEVFAMQSGRGWSSPCVAQAHKSVPRVWRVRQAMLADLRSNAAPPGRRRGRSSASCRGTADFQPAGERQARTMRFRFFCGHEVTGMVSRFVGWT